MSTITTTDGRADLLQGPGSRASHRIQSRLAAQCGRLGCAVFFASHGFRCVAHDRRGRGRSAKTWDGNEMDTYSFTAHPS